MSPSASFCPADSAKNITLFCIPHAGGNASYYTNFKTFFTSNVSLHPLELAGRGRRWKEPLETGMEAIGRDLFTRILPVARTSAYALFGHSMGGVLALLCAVHAYENKMPLPSALFISACPPPGCFSPRIPVSSPNEMWRHAIELGGIPEDLPTELRKYFEPILFADFTALSQWRPRDLPGLPVPITVFLGKQDKITVEEETEWARFTTREFAIRSFDGGHFYVQDHWEALASHIAQTLSMLA